MKVLLINILLTGLLFSNTTSFFSVNYIGRDKDFIEQHIKTNLKNLKLNTTTVNNTYKYLKFEDKISEITVLFFLSDDDKCTFIRLMSDYSNISDMIYELDKLYTKIDKNNWKYFENNKEYNVKLEEGDWFFTITIKAK